MEYSEKTSQAGGAEEVSSPLLRRYYQYLKLEKGLSENTVEAYMADLQKLLDFLSAGGIGFREVREDDLHAFMAGLFSMVMSSASSKVNVCNCSCAVSCIAAITPQIKNTTLFILSLLHHANVNYISVHIYQFAPWCGVLELFSVCFDGLCSVLQLLSVNTVISGHAPMRMKAPTYPIPSLMYRCLLSCSYRPLHCL